ncbi:protein-disulfide isomerase [Sphingobium xanthum]|jgi:protein-disulfide isomerase|uniref:DsbA family protein n=1 Tax=Sphingobium xanthum TaxID=1387165 RepID=UPI001C8B2F95|nr:DsbA family protein [Sphingobium xanthum]
MTDRPTLKTILRAGGVILSALTTRTGTRTRRRLVAPTLIAMLVTGGAAVAYAAADSESKAVAATDRAAIEAIVRDYILEHPEIIPEAVKRLQAREAAAKIDENRAELETPYKGAWEGAERPRVTLVAFMDYACGYCRASLPDLQRLVKDNPDLRIVYHELPVITQGSAGAAKVSMLAAEAGKFTSFHQAMYAAGGVESDLVLKAAAKAGLDAAQAKAALGDSSRDEALMGNIRLAQALGGEGTPLFVVGDEMFNGQVGYDVLKAAIQKARDKG